jgi:hypothetical protein
MNIQAMLGTGVGPYFTPSKCIVYNRTGGTVAIGDVLALDYLNAESGHGDVALDPNTDEGNATAATKCWPLGNAILPVTGTIGENEGDPGAIFGVVTSLMQGAGANDTKVELTIQGVVKAKMSGSITFGMELYPVNAQSHLVNYVVNDAAQEGIRRIGKALHSGSSKVDWILFDGISGVFGQGGDFTTA